jgi:hypothetical protein
MYHDQAEVRQPPQPAPKVAVRGNQTAKKALAEAILDYVKQDKAEATKILAILTSGTYSSLREMTEQQAAAAMERFTLNYLGREPGDDDIADYEVPEDPRG